MHISSHNCRQLSTRVGMAARRLVHRHFDASANLQSEAAGSNVARVRRLTYVLANFLSKIFIRNIRNFTPYENFPLYGTTLLYSSLELNSFLATLDKRYNNTMLKLRGRCSNGKED